MQDQESHFVDELSGMIDARVAEYLEAFNSVEETIQNLRNLELTIGPALQLFASLYVSPHEVEADFETVSQRVKALRLALKETERTRVRVIKGSSFTIHDPKPFQLQPGEWTKWLQGSFAHSNYTPDLGPRLPTEGRLRDIYEIMEEVGRPMRSKEIAERLVDRGELEGVENPESAIAAHLSRGVKQGLFWRPQRGLYAINEDVEEKST